MMNNNAFARKYIQACKLISYVKYSMVKKQKDYIQIIITHLMTMEDDGKFLQLAEVI